MVPTVILHPFFRCPESSKDFPDTDVVRAKRFLINFFGAFLPPNTTLAFPQNGIPLCAIFYQGPGRKESPAGDDGCNGYVKHVWYNEVCLERDPWKSKDIFCKNPVSGI